jgi:phage-related protein
MTDSRAKGARGETVVRDLLRELTGLQWERVPMSGALAPTHKLKGDLYVPETSMKYCVEVKNYADDHFTSKLLTSKSPQLIEWWEQTVREAMEVNKEPLLIFKFDRSKIFVAYEPKPTVEYNYTHVNVNGYSFNVSLLNDWINREKPEWLKPSKN